MCDNMAGELPQFFIIGAYLFIAACVSVLICFIIPVTIIRILVKRYRKKHGDNDLF
jgi:uncharacterized MAPEG superfamily protein